MIGGAVAAALATMTVVGLANASEGRTTSRLGGIQVTQDQTSYIVTIPDAQDGSARLLGHTLQVETRDRIAGLQSEQHLTLPDADPAGEPRVTRQNGSLVVTVSKGNSSFGAASASPLPMSTFEQDLFARMEEMQRRMDAMFDGAFAHRPTLGSFRGQGSLGPISSGLKLNLQDKGSNYVVRAENFDPQERTVNVAVDNERILKITAEQEKATAGSKRYSHFTQAFTLPGPVKSAEMKIDQQGGALVVTLPKA